MSEACHDLHQAARERRRHHFPFDPADLPTNGVYLLFERGEQAHGGERIVRVGTHRGENQLAGRLQEHFINPNKDRSIFRKNIGRALLRSDGDPFLEQWDLDLTSRENRERYEGQIDLARQAEIERAVTERIRENFSFAVLEVPDPRERLELEARVIGTVAQCQECGASTGWLGRSSPKPKIRDSGLWQEQHLSHAPLRPEDLGPLDGQTAPAVEVRPQDQFLRSTFYEQLTEHVFISEVLQEAWFGFGETVEVLRAEIDTSGYDLVLECRGVIRHVQLKTSREGARRGYQKVHVSLADKPGGCMVWLVRHREKGERRMRLTYRYFGAAPGEPLPSLDEFKVARHTKANAQGVKAQRAAIRKIPRGRFERVETTARLLERLFGLGSGG